MSVKLNRIVLNSLPVAFGYLALGFTFGVLFNSKGGTVLEAFLISSLCFAGAAQFVALEFYRPGFSGIFLFSTIFILNIRHVFYGLKHLNLWQSGPSRVYLFSALTDENFGMTNLYSDQEISQDDWVKIFAINHSYWIIGCTSGALVPSTYMNHIQGAEFSLVALFIVLFCSSIKAKARRAI